MSPRDTQRSKVYAAEDAYWRSTHDGRGYFQTIPTADLTAYVNAVLDKRAVRSRWGARSVRVELGRGGARAHGSHTVSFGVNARNELIVCHELAHVLTPSRYAAHGPEWVGIYLHLVRTVIGETAARDLGRVMRQHKVRVSLKGIPPVSDDVPAPRADRERAAKAEAREMALAKVRRMLANGTITKADLRRLAS